jgi:hypothetical protein
LTYIVLFCQRCPIQQPAVLLTLTCASLILSLLILVSLPRRDFRNLKFQNELRNFYLVADRLSLYQISSVARMFRLRLLSPEYLSSALISNLEVRKASKLLRPTELIGFDVIFGFAIKDCSDILVPVHKYVLHLSLCPWYCLTSWMQAPVIPFFFFLIKATAPLLVTRPIPILNTFLNYLNYLNLPCMTMFYIT